MMQEQDFIAVWPNLVRRELCEVLIEDFHRQRPSDLIDTKKQGLKDRLPLHREDFAFFLNYHSKYVGEIQNKLWEVLEEYVSHFQQLQEVPLWTSDIKMQLTKPGGGYHSWHYENSGYNCAQRELVWMIYLNDMPEGEAETEFLHQKRRIRPTQGTVVVWPAGFTHVHRGLTALTQDKYILTGWYIRIPR